MRRKDNADLLQTFGLEINLSGLYFDSGLAHAHRHSNKECL